MSKQEKESNNKSNQRGWVWVLFIFIVVQVVLANSLVVRGKEIRKLAAERDSLRADIISLENEVACSSSLTAVQQGAEAMGLRPGTIEFLPPTPLAAAMP